MGSARFIWHVLGWCLLVTLTLCGQEPPCQQRTFPVSVTNRDRDGSLVRDLAPADFRAEFRGQPVKILTVLPDDHPHRIIILLDASGSMRGETGRRWVTAVAAAQELAQANLENVSLALWIFGERVDERIGFSQDKRQVAEKLQQVRNDIEFFKKHVYGATRLYDTVSRALDAFGFLSAGDVIYVLTDGADNASRIRVKDLRRELVSSRVRLFVCISLIDPYRGIETLYRGEKKGLKEIEKLTYETGGGYFGPIGMDSHGHMLPSLTDEDLAVTTKRLDTFHQALTQNYRMEADFGTSVDKPREWKLRVVDGAGAERKELRVAYPSELMPCQAAPSPK